MKIKRWNAATSTWVEDAPDVYIANIVASGSPSSSNFLRGDGVWAIPTDTNNFVSSATFASNTLTLNRQGLTAITVDLSSLATDANNFLTGVSGSGNGTVTFTRSGLTNLTWDASHTHEWLSITGHRTLFRDDAGLQGNAGARSGFFETSAPTNYYAGANSWQHLIEARHTNDGNNYAMQIAGSFFDQEFYVRKTNNVASTAWSRMWHSGNFNPANYLLISSVKEQLKFLYIYGKAQSAITKGQAVQFAGVQGDHILMKPAVPNEINANPDYFIGIAEATLATDAFGYILTQGELTGLNTSGYTAGNILWFASAGSTAGALTATEPTGANAKIQVASVNRVNPGDGILFVRVNFVGTEIEDIVATGTPSATTFLRGDGSWNAVTATNVGLGNVDNTSDANKPVSSATQTALNAKLNLTGGTVSGTLAVSGVLDSTNISTTPDKIGNIKIARLHETGVSAIGNIDNLESFILSKTNSGFGLGTKPSGSHNGFGIISLQTHSANYFSQIGLDTNQNALWTRSANGTTSYGSWQRVFADDYHPNADTLTTARTLTIGSTGKTFNGSADVSWSLTDIGLGNVANESKATMFTSPTFTGTPVATTAAAGTNTTQVATTAFVQTAVSGLVDAAPGTLDTLNELAAALGDDPNFATTVSTNIGTKVSKAGDTMTGNLVFGNNSNLGLVNTAGTAVFYLDDAYNNTYIKSDNGFYVDANAYHFRDASSTTKLYMDSSTGNVGIGTTSPRTKLNVTSGTSAGVTPTLGSANNSSAIFTNSVNAYGLNVMPSGTGDVHLQVQRFDGVTSVYDLNLQPLGGNVGIGTTDPVNKLEIKGSHGDTMLRLFADNAPSGAQASLHLWASEPGITFDGVGIGANVNGSIGYGKLTNGLPSSAIRFHNGEFKFVTSPATSEGYTERFTIQQGGNVGIGTTTPATKLSVFGAAGAENLITLDNNFSNKTIYGINNYIRGVSNGGFSLRDETAGVERFVISSGGNVGIGTTSPVAKLHVAGDATINNTTLGVRSNTTTYGGNTAGLTINSVAEIRSPQASASPALTFHYENLATRHLIMNSSGEFQFLSPSTENSGVAVVKVNSNVVWHAGNDGAGSGLDADTLDGVQGTNYFRVDGTYPNADMNTTVEGYWHVQPTAANLPIPQFGHRWDYDHLNNGQWVAQFYSATSDTDSLWFRQKRNYEAQPWQKLWSSTNDGTGSGLDADLLDGYNSSVAATANTVVVRDANAYIYGSFFNSNRADQTTAAASYIYDTGDGWMRKKTLANAQTEIVSSAAVTAHAPSKTGTGASGTWSISVSGSAATLTTARNINGVSFNGSADITITANPNAHTHTAADTTSGTFDVARIPNLSASKITSGTIDVARLPAIAITDVFTATTLANFVSTVYSLDPNGLQEGDILILTTDNQTYVHNGGTAGTSADFTLLRTPTDLVTSVSGKQGVVTLVKGDVGLGNVDNTADNTKTVANANRWTSDRTITIGNTGKTVNGTGNVSWTLAEIGATNNTGTVTSVGLSLPTDVFTGTGSVTTSGTLTRTFANQNANTVFAGPTTGLPGVPAFRTLAAEDLPAHTHSIANVTGLQTALDGKAASSHDISTHSDVIISSPSSGQVLKWNGLAWTNQADNNTTYTLGSFGVTSTATELNILDGVTATTAELNVLDGITATTTELNYTDGVTSNIQTQLNSRLPIASAPYYSPVAGSILVYNTTFGWLTNTVGYWVQIRSRGDADLLTSTGASGSTGGTISAAALAQGDTIMMEVNDTSSVDSTSTPQIVTFTLGGADTDPISTTQSVNWRSSWDSLNTSYLYHFKVSFSGSTLYFDDSFRLNMVDSSTASSILGSTGVTLFVGRIWRLNQA
jgi:hypothetical protein